MGLLFAVELKKKISFKQVHPLYYFTNKIKRTKKKIIFITYKRKFFLNSELRIPSSQSLQNIGLIQRGFSSSFLK